MEFTTQTDADVIADGLAVALGWAKTHPGRDALDAATVAVMNDSMPGVPLVLGYARLGGSLWPEFLQAVRGAM